MSDQFPNDLAIRLHNVSVKYRMPTEPVRTLKEQTIRYFKGQRTAYRDFLGLDGISLDIKRGEFTGLIGRNGAGKSTLLKVLSRILKPTTGRVIMRGNIASIIELA